MTSNTTERQYRSGIQLAQPGDLLEMTAEGVASYGNAYFLVLGSKVFNPDPQQHEPSRLQYQVLDNDELIWVENRFVRAIILGDKEADDAG